jgi:hypothetical protein
MLKNNRNRTVGVSLVMGAVMFLTFSNPREVVAAAASQPGNAAGEVWAAGDPAVLDAHRRLALGMIETGNRDDEIGGAGEVSRYQIMPSVWRQYSRSLNYRNPEVSLTVAQKHWAKLYAAFIRQAHRQPTDFDMYVLWNTHYGYYASRGFNPDRLAPTVRDRAQRYVNLVQSADI